MVVLPSPFLRSLASALRGRGRVVVAFAGRRVSRASINIFAFNVTRYYCWVDESVDGLLLNCLLVSGTL